MYYYYWCQNSIEFDYCENIDLNHCCYDSNDEHRDALKMKVRLRYYYYELLSFPMGHNDFKINKINNRSKLPENFSFVIKNQDKKSLEKVLIKQSNPSLGITEIRCVS